MRGITPEPAEPERGRVVHGQSLGPDGAAVRRCHHCWAEVIECPSHCRFSGWKHMDTGLHRCDLPNLRLRGRYEWLQRQLFAYRPSLVLEDQWHPAA